MINDYINGGFEFIGGLLLWWNVKQLYKDKVVKGVKILPTAFFAAWGYWNLYYYPSLNQTISFIAGVFLVIANTTWVIMAIYYTKRNKLWQPIIKRD